MDEHPVVAERAAIDRVVGLRTVCDLYSRNVARHRHAPAIAWWDDRGRWRDLTWEQYREHVADVAVGLADLGVGPGDAVVLMLGNRPEHLVADGAALHLSAAPVPLHHDLARPELLQAARSTRAVVAVLDGPDVLARWDDLRKDLPHLRRVVLVDHPEDHEHLEWVLSWDDVLHRGRAGRQADPLAFDARWARVRADDTAAVLFPRTGRRPLRGMRLTHRNVRWTAESVRLGLGLGEEGTGVCAGPLADAPVRLASHWLALRTAACTVLTDSCEPRELRAAIGAVRPTTLLAPPAVWEEVAEHLAAVAAPAAGAPAPAGRALEAGRAVVRLRRRGEPVTALLRLRAAVGDRFVLRRFRAAAGLGRCTTAVAVPGPVPPAVVDHLGACGIPLLEAHGSAETTGLATSCTSTRWRPGTVGVPLPGVEVELASDGEVLVRGDNVLAGFWDDPRATAAVVDDGGWLHTGVRGHIDPAGYLTFEGRAEGGASPTGR